LMNAHRFILGLVFVTLAAATTHAATPRATLFGESLVPANQNARDFADPGWGGGVEISWPINGTAGMLAAYGGIQAPSLLSDVQVFRDQLTGLRVEQHTDQVYGRLFFGGQMGPHGNGFIEPYANVALALVVYGINTDVVVPDDSNRENSINQHLRD